MAPDITWWTGLADSVRAAARGEAPLDEPVRMLRDGLDYNCAVLIGAQDSIGRAAQPVLVNVDYPVEIAAFIASTYALECPGHRYAIQRPTARRFIDLPFDFRASRTYREALHPCGFREGLTLPLGVFDGAGPRPAFVAMSSTHARPLSDTARLALTMLSSEIAGLTAPQTRPEIARADLVMQIGNDGVSVRLGDPGQSPLDRSELSRVADLHRRGPDGLRFRCRDVHGQWWSIRTDDLTDGVLIRLDRTASPGGLTPRELDVVGLASRGWPNDQIAGALGISVRTARAHIESALLKIGVANRTALAREACEQELDSLEAIRCVRYVTDGRR